MDQEPAEIVLANTIIDKFSLKHPLDVFSFASSFADIHQSSSLPSGVDGLFFQKIPSAKPQIFLNSNSYKPRAHFTLAHELGHYFIPWHPKTIAICNSEEENYISTFGLEKEANNFAGELLMPKKWILELEKTMSIGSIVNFLVSNNISIEAACINVSQKTTKELCITVQRRGEQSKNYPPRTGERLSVRSPAYDHQVLSEENISLGIYSILIREVRKAIYTFYAKQFLSAKEIFEELSNEIDDKHAAWRSLNGSIAGLNGSRKPLTPESLFQHSMRSIVDNPHAKNVSRETLERFVSARCEELFQKKQAH